MMKKLLNTLLSVTLLAAAASAQVPIATHIQILKAEDARRYDETLAALMKHKDVAVHTRAALAAGRIGDEAAIPALISLLNGDPSPETREMAAFALGEIESIKAADVILQAIGETGKPLMPGKVEINNRGRLAEAAGKIAAANAKDPKAKDLGDAILFTLEAEHLKGTAQDKETVLLAITAALRARPEKTDVTVAKFLSNSDARVRADAANTLSRVRAKNANETLRSMLVNDTDPIARANAARALGSAEDKEALTVLINASTKDGDSRVRVSAIRSLGTLKEAKAADMLLDHSEKVLSEYKKSKFANPAEKNELLEIASTLGRILPNSGSGRAIKLLSEFREADKYSSPETEIAFAQIAPKVYVNLPMFEIPVGNGFGFGFFAGAGVIHYVDQRSESLGNFAQAFASIADNSSADKETAEKAKKYIAMLVAGLPNVIVLANPEVILSMNGTSPNDPQIQATIKKSTQKFERLKRSLNLSFPDILRAAAKLKTEDYERDIAYLLLNKDVIVGSGKDGTKFATTYESNNPAIREQERKEREFYGLHKDPIVRATAAELIGQIKDLNSVSALESAFDYAVSNDHELNDAQLAILEAIAKQKGPTSNRVLTKALDSPDYLVRKKAFELVIENDLQKDFPNAESKVGIVNSYDPKSGTKLGQVLNTDADYRRALSRKNGTVKAVLATDKGTFTIDLLPEDAPLTVDNFVKLARANYFNGLEVHRVVPNFVMQDGDPRGDGNGGPGWSIRCELNMVPFGRGVIGMALSGKDTGGSQWFATHSPQPHLDGGYTVFGRVDEKGMKVVDNIVRGDKILSVKILEGPKQRPPQRRR